MSRITKFVTLKNIAQPRGARKAGHQHHYMSRFAAVRETEYDHDLEREEVNIEKEYLKEDATAIVCSKKGDENMNNWIPHPRTGIFYPEGQDWVLNDVSENSASLGQAHTYWLRNIHGVEKHDPDLSADHYFLTQDHA